MKPREFNGAEERAVVVRLAATLTQADLDMFAQLRIDPELLARAGVRRVTDHEARQEYGLNGSGDNAGILFPYVDTAGKRHTCRLDRYSCK